MYPIILTIHAVLGVLLVLVILVQAGRSGGISGLFGGGGGGDALFTAASQQAGLRKATVAIAGLFMATSLGLTVLSSRRSGHSVFARPDLRMPAVPGQPAPLPETAPAPAAAPVTGDAP